MNHFFGPILEALGIKATEQLMYGVVICLATFVAYALRYRKRDAGYSALFLIIGVTLLVLLFTESQATRAASALVFAASIVLMFMYAFVRQRRARAERRS